MLPDGTKWTLGQRKPYICKHLNCKLVSKFEHTHANNAKPSTIWLWFGICTHLPVFTWKSGKRTRANLIFQNERQYREKTDTLTTFGEHECELSAVVLCRLNHLWPDLDCYDSQNIVRIPISFQLFPMNTRNESHGIECKCISPESNQTNCEQCTIPIQYPNRIWNHIRALFCWYNQKRRTHL